MKEPKWITEQMALAIHEEAVAQFGGLSGVRAPGLLSSALARPQQLHSYEPASTLFRLAATLCIGIAKNHPFLDGNKPTALLSARAFLFLNGQVFEPEESDEVETMVRVGGGTIDDAALSKWFQDHSSAATRRKK